MNEAEKKLMSFFTLMFVILGGLIICYELDKNGKLEQNNKKENKIERNITKQVQKKEEEQHTVQRKTHTRKQTRNYETKEENKNIRQNKIERDFTENRTYNQNKVERNPQVNTIQKEKEEGTFLLQENHCNVQRKTSNEAIYCRIGANSKYVANKEVSKGKYYFETKAILTSGNGGVFANIGLISDNTAHKFCSLSGYDHNGQCSSVAVYEGTNNKNLKNNDIIGVAFDLNKGLLFHSINGVWDEEPKKITTLGIKYTPVVIADRETSWEVNFGEKRFKYPMPIGYNAFGETTIYQRIEKLVPNKYNPDKVTLIKPKYCRSTNNKTNHAKYCEIGAKSIYLANKKLNRGKYYYEAQLVTENNSSTPFNNIGLLSDSSRSQSCFIDSRSNNGDCNGVEIFTWQERGKLKHNDVIGLFVDFDNNKINYSRNGVMNKTPVTFSYLQSGYAPAFEVGSNSTWIINFGERNFKYNKPAGYNTLNKKEAL